MDYGTYIGQQLARLKSRLITSQLMGHALPGEYERIGGIPVFHLKGSEVTESGKQAAATEGVPSGPQVTSRTSSHSVVVVGNRQKAWSKTEVIGKVS